MKELSKRKKLEILDKLEFRLQNKNFYLCVEICALLGCKWSLLATETACKAIPELKLICPADCDSDKNDLFGWFGTIENNATRIVRLSAVRKLKEIIINGENG
jgi:hypothetical protein